MRSISPPSGSATCQGAEPRENLHRGLRSLASLVEVVRRVQAGEPPDRFQRRILISTMGLVNARTGATLQVCGDGTVRVAEIVGLRSRPNPRIPLDLPEPACASLRSAYPLHTLKEAEALAWRAAVAPLDPPFDPQVLVRLGGQRLSSFLLLGGLDDPAHESFGRRGLRSALTGLIEIMCSFDRIAAGPRVAALGPDERALDDFRRLEPSLRRFVGNSPAIASLLSDVIAVAGSNCPVLLEGESGTGKELLARIVHEISSGANAPFEAINCGAIPEALVESELFGHVAGAFTGATRNHRGVFERAHGGSVFLDEITEMPPSAQVKLLRVLQEGTFSPVGGEELHRCTARILAATNGDLQQAVESRRFRQDLFYRLHVFPIRIRPLRERPEDIPLLVQDFLDRFSDEAGQPRRAVEEDALRRLSVYSYPGNVRELQNIMRALIVEARDENRIADRHVISVFSRHRVSGRPGETRASRPGTLLPLSPDQIGPWILDELRRYHFNLALAARMLEARRRTAPDRRAIPVFSRSGLTYYLQGECFRALCDETWSRHRAALRVAGGEAFLDRVRTKLDHFLDGAMEALRTSEPTPQRRLESLRCRFSKLPEPYAGYLRRISEAYEGGQLA